MKFRTMRRRRLISLYLLFERVNSMALGWSVYHAKGQTLDQFLPSFLSIKKPVSSMEDEMAAQNQ